MKANCMLKVVLVMAMSVMTVSCIHRTRVFTDSGNVSQQSEVRNLKGFEEIEINVSPTVYYSQSDSFSVKVVGSSKSVADIVTDVVDGTLTIKNRGKVGVFNVVLDEEGQAAVYVSSPDLIGVRLNGSGDFIGKSQVDTDKMEIALRGSGDISFDNIICDECQIDLVGSGDIGIDALEAKDVSATLVGSGDIKLKEKNVQSTVLGLKGSGDISVNFGQGCKVVSCELRGSGDITLSGSVDRYSMQKSGSGEVDVDDLTTRE